MALKITVTVQIPDKLFDDRAAVDRIARAQRNQTIPDVKALFAGTVVGWQNRPYFSARQDITSNSIGVTIWAAGPNAAIYALVNEGSPEHDIYPINAPALRFQPGYVSSTHPRSLTSQAYRRFGGFVRSMHVSHPGFEGREFAETIADEYVHQFADDMQDAISP